MPALTLKTPTALPAHQPARHHASKPDLTPWVAIKIVIWSLAAVVTMISVPLLSLVAGVPYGILAGTSKVFGQLVTVAVPDLRRLWSRWVER